MSDIKTGTIEIKGLAELEKRLQALPDKLAGNVLKGAIRAGAAVIRDAAKRNVRASTKAHWLYSRRTKKMKAEGKHYQAYLIQPGSLRKGIKVRLAPRKSRSVPIEYWVYVSKKLWYWKFLEFGTANMGAKAFMRPAFESERVAATERIREYLAARIDKELGK